MWITIYAGKGVLHRNTKNNEVTFETSMWMKKREAVEAAKWVKEYCNCEFAKFLMKDNNAEFMKALLMESFRVMYQKEYAHLHRINREKVSCNAAEGESVGINRNQ